MSVDTAGADRSQWKGWKRIFDPTLWLSSAVEVDSTADEGHSTGWKLQLIHYYRDLFAPAISTDMSQVGVAVFPPF